MIDYHTNIITALSTIGLPLHYEMMITSKTGVPCITYLEIADAVQQQSDKSDIGIISYQVKVWANSIETIQQYAPQVDLVMRELGFQRTGAVEIKDNNSLMIQKVLTYEANTLEQYL